MLKINLGRLGQVMEGELSKWEQILTTCFLALQEEIPTKISP